MLERTRFLTSARASGCWAWTGEFHVDFDSGGFYLARLSSVLLLKSLASCRSCS